MANYVAPYIDSTGLHINPYPSIVQWFAQQYQNVYGPNVYLGFDAADYQDISIRAKQNSDLENALQSVYLSFNILTAIGASLDLLGNLIGVPRKSATYSTATVTVVGTPYVNITNGVAQDTVGNYWNLPTVVSVPSGGSINVTATAQTLGPISAIPGAISIIATPTLGWTSVNNAASASTGLPIEPDSNYRARLTISQAQPSITTLAGTAAALAALYGVTRSTVYENPTNSTQSFGIVNTSGTAVTLELGFPFDSSFATQQININGVVYTVTTPITSGSLTLTSSAGTQTGVPFFMVLGGPVATGPAHSLSCVVEGGVPQNIANAIYNNRGLGCFTQGNQSSAIAVIDPNNGSLTSYINYYTLQYTPIYVTLTVHPLTGFTSSTQAAIQANIVSYLNSLSIGETVVYSELYGAALTARPNPDQPEFSIRSIASGTSASPVGTIDIPIQYNYASQGLTGNVIVTLV